MATKKAESVPVQETQAEAMEETQAPAVKAPEEIRPVICTGGNTMASAVGVTFDPNLHPVIALYSTDSGWNKGAMVFCARTQDGAGALLNALVTAEIADLTAAGFDPQTRADAFGVSVEDKASRIAPTKFLTLGRIVQDMNIAIPQDKIQSLMAAFAADTPATQPAENDSVLEGPAGYATPIPVPDAPAMAPTPESDAVTADDPSKEGSPFDY